MQRKYLSFFKSIHTVKKKKKKGKREGQCIQSGTRKRTPFQSKMVYKWVMGSLQLGQ